MAAAHEAQWLGTQPQQMRRKQKLQVAWPAAPQHTEQDGFTQQRSATPAIRSNTLVHFEAWSQRQARTMHMLQHGSS